MYDRVSFYNILLITVTVVKGEKGEKGEAGLSIQGEVGPPGPQGPIGEHERERERSRVFRMLQQLTSDYRIGCRTSRDER